MSMPAPDVAVLEADWKPRVLLRAQLIEDGFTVVATDTWPMMADYLQAPMKPRVAILDLQGLEHPGEVLRATRALMTPGRVVVLAALGTLARSEIEALGFRVLARPVSVDHVVAAARRAIAEAV
jgi:DNA-binding response OmpR family regulator